MIDQGVCRLSSKWATPTSQFFLNCGAGVRGQELDQRNNRSRCFATPTVLSRPSPTWMRLGQTKQRCRFVNVAGLALSVEQCVIGTGRWRRVYIDHTAVNSCTVHSFIEADLEPTPMYRLPKTTYGGYLTPFTVLHNHLSTSYGLVPQSFDILVDQQRHL
jgi:hypothetical protein